MLLAARDQPTTVTGLASLMGTTKQAASKLVEAMVMSGCTELEQEWAQVIGAPHLQRMRRDLVRILSDANDGALPPVRPLW